MERLRLNLHTPFLLGLGAAGLLTLHACKKEEAPPVAQAPAAPVEVLSSEDAEAHPVTGGGTVRGTVTFTGQPPAPLPINPSTDPNCEGMDLVEQPVQVKEGRLANVLVRIRGEVPGQPKAPPDSLVVVDQNRCTYLPRVQGAVTGQRMVMMNSDGTLHNVRGVSKGKTLFNVNQPPLKTKEAQPPADAEIIRLKCDIHPWMVAWVVMNPHPYFATSGEDGTFEIQGVPPGTYTVEAWHELLGTKEAQVTVKEGQVAQVAFEFSQR
jgi:hypothetical protein